MPSYYCRNCQKRYFAKILRCSCCGDFICRECLISTACPTCYIKNSQPEILNEYTELRVKHEA